jgi:pyruvate dehydrogenase E2 component (dihydrolipoamide acetyltransferase)
MTALTIPQLSISMEEAKVSRWLAGDGEAVVEGQPLVEVETDKATVEIVAPASGVLRILAPEGAIVAVEAVIAEVEAGAAAGAAPAPGIGSAPEAAAATVHAANGVSSPRRDGPIASPAARRLARERGVEIATLRGSGPGGRIVARDVPAPAAAASPGPAAAEADRIREAVVRNIAASWQQIPHVHIGGELAADGLLRAKASAPTGERAVTVTDLLLVALGRALAEVPELNATRSPDGSVVRSSAIDISIAVATPNGVIAPVLRDAGSRTLADLSRERRRLVQAARQGALDGRELVGGTCTLSNLGAYPVDFFAPVISGPQVAMVATGRVADRVVADNGWFGVRPRMWVNVAIDHRAADGEAGGRLLAALERQIAQLPGGPA